MVSYFEMTRLPLESKITPFQTKLYFTIFIRYCQYGDGSFWTVSKNSEIAFVFEEKHKVKLVTAVESTRIVVVD